MTSMVSSRRVKSDGPSKVAGFTLLDNFLPAYDFRERHHAFVNAYATRAARALRQLSPAALPLMQMLMAIRSIPSRLSGRGGWAPDSRRSVLEEFGEAGFLTLAEDDREIVVRRIGQFWKLAGGETPQIPDPQAFVTFRRAGFVKVATNFPIRARDPGSTEVSTETRIAAMDGASRLKFAVYRAVIRPGSRLGRREWLGAIKRSGERD